MRTIHKVIIAVGSEEIEEYISVTPNVEHVEVLEDISLIEEILAYENYDYVIVNTLLSPRKTVKLAEFIEHDTESYQKPKIIALIEDFKDKKLIAQLVGLGVNAFVNFDELHLVQRYLDNYPKGFDLSILSNTAKISDSKEVSATKVISGTISIGVFNLENGAGSTTCSLNLAREIANCGYSVICIEIDKEDFSFVKNKNRNLELVSTRASEKDALLQIAFSDPKYQFIVIDFGKLLEAALDGHVHVMKKDLIGDFLRCNYKVGMCYSAPWHTPKIDTLLKNDFFKLDLMKGQLFLQIYGEGAKETIEDYHELPLFEREAEYNEFLLHLKASVGISNSKKGADKRKSLIANILRRDR